MLDGQFKHEVPTACPPTPTSSYHHCFLGFCRTQGYHRYFLSSFPQAFPLHSIANLKSLGPGDLQWMTAGRGIVHCEMPLGDKPSTGLQLWVNLVSFSSLVQGSDVILI